MSEQRHRVRNGILLGMTLRPSASDAHIPPLSTTVRAFRISNNKTRSTDFSSRPRTPRLCPPTHARVIFLSYPYSRLTIEYEPNHSTIRRTRADISKSVKKRRRSRERAEKEAGTCAHVRTIELGRKERKEYP
ncbi:hypothetical protein V1477_000624 [Vespula maculifrons]|uniref:Uncharacterized protein n=1 Tax=Vespula maculifrons TaxID=7453 RepID=A0ABD2D259_VESMC